MNHAARRAVGAAAFFLAATFLAGPVFASGTCLQFRVVDRFVAPDGRLEGPGMVKICPHWSISPSLRLSRIYFNGQLLGVWMLRAGEGGRFNDDGFNVTLRRLPAGKVALADYFWMGPDGLPDAPGLRSEQLEANSRAAEGPLAAPTATP